MTSLSKVLSILIILDKGKLETKSYLCNNPSLWVDRQKSSAGNISQPDNTRSKGLGLEKC